MASASVQATSSGRSVPPAQRQRHAVRRRAVLLIFVGAVAAMAIAINYGPITHLLDAKERLATRTAEVEALKAETAAMEGRLSKLMQPGYLEELAREGLTYALPGEVLYIVTGETADGEVALTPAEDVAAGDASGLGTGLAATDVQPGAEAGETEGEPGFLERLLLGIASLF